MRTVYVCIATGYNIINALPFTDSFKNEVEKVIILSTEKAKNSGFTDRLKNYFEFKKEDLIIQIEEVEQSGNDIILNNSKIIEHILGEFSDQKIVFNIGGGQKILTLSAITLKDKLKEIVFIYPNIESGHIEVYPSNSEFDRSEILNKYLEFEDYKHLNGFEIKTDNRNQNYVFLAADNIQNGTSFQIDYEELMSYEEFRSYFYLSNTNQKFLDKLNEDLYYSKIGQFLSKERFSKLNELGSEMHDTIQLIISNELKVLKNQLMEFNERESKYLSDKFSEYPQSSLKRLIKFTLSENRINNLYKGINKFQFQNAKLIDLLQLESNILSNNSFTSIFKKKYGINIMRGDFFEGLVVQRLINILSNNENYISKISEIHSNVIIRSNTTKQDLIELDILIIGNNGKCIIVESKSFDLNKKDINSRLFNIRKYFGEYIDVIIAFPYYIEDIVSNKMNISSITKKIPFLINNWDINVHSAAINSDQVDKYLLNDKLGIREAEDKNDPKAIEVKSFESVLKILLDKF